MRSGYSNNMAEVGFLLNRHLRMILVVLLAVAIPAQADEAIYSNGFESGYPCDWSDVVPIDSCAPAFSGVSLAAATGTEQITLGWLPAVDDSTLPEHMLYRVYLGDCVEPFELSATIHGGTGVVLAGLEPTTTYCVDVVAEDEDGLRSHEPPVPGRFSSVDDPSVEITTLTYDQVPTETELQTAESLHLGSPQVTPTTLTFEKGSALGSACSRRSTDRRCRRPRE